MTMGLDAINAWLARGAPEGEEPQGEGPALPGAPQGGGGLSFTELYNPPKGWAVEMHSDGVYWRQEPSDAARNAAYLSGRPLPTGLLYNPRTEMIESAPGSDKWVPAPLRKPAATSRQPSQYQQDKDARARSDRLNQQGISNQASLARTALDKYKADLGDKFDRDKLANDRDVADAKAKADDAERKAGEARDQRNFDAAERWKQVGRQWTERVDTLNRAWDEKLFTYKQEQSVLDRAQREGELVGEVGGRPTLGGRAQALREKQYEDELANASKNFFNYAFRMRGYEPPALAGQPATGTPAPGSPIAPTAPGAPGAPAPETTPIVPPGFSRPSGPGPNRADIGRDAGPGGLDIPGLKAKYSATELARLDLGSLAQFSNEDLLEIGKQYPGGVQAFLNLFPRERIIGAGQYGGSGFGSEYQRAYDQAHPENLAPGELEARYLGAPGQAADGNEFNPAEAWSRLKAGQQPPWSPVRIPGAPASPREEDSPLSPDDPDIYEYDPHKGTFVRPRKFGPGQVGTMEYRSPYRYDPSTGMMRPLDKGSKNPNVGDMFYKGPRPSEPPPTGGPLSQSSPMGALPGAPAAAPAWAGNVGAPLNAEEDWRHENQEG